MSTAKAPSIRSRRVLRLTHRNEAATVPTLSARNQACRRWRRAEAAQRGCFNAKHHGEVEQEGFIVAR